jgi:hypothetical protein
MRLFGFCLRITQLEATGERLPNPVMCEALAAALNVEPSFFTWQLHSGSNSCRAQLIPPCSEIWWSVHVGPKEKT